MIDPVHYSEEDDCWVFWVDGEWYGYDTEKEARDAFHLYISDGAPGEVLDFGF